MNTEPPTKDAGCDCDRLLAVADNLADRLRSANAVIERMAAAQFNPAIFDRIREALDEHRDVCGIKGLRDGD